MDALDGLAADTVTQIVERLAVNEGVRLSRYLDTMSIPTIGIGFNLDRDDAAACLSAVGCNAERVLSGLDSLTQPQAYALMRNDLPHFINGARDVLPTGAFNALTAPRQAALVDMAYNLGTEGLGGFNTFLHLLGLAQQHKTAGDDISAHAYFTAAASHILISAYAEQVGDRARRNAAMISTGAWVDPNGSGS